MLQLVAVIVLSLPCANASNSRAWIVATNADDIIGWITSKADSIAQGQIVERGRDTIRVRRQVNRQLVDIRLKERLVRYAGNIVQYRADLERVYTGPINAYQLSATLRPQPDGQTRIDVSIAVGTATRAGQVKISESITEALDNFQRALVQRYGRQ